MDQSSRPGSPLTLRPFPSVWSLACTPKFVKYTQEATVDSLLKNGSLIKLLSKNVSLQCIQLPQPQL